MHDVYSRRTCVQAPPECPKVRHETLLVFYEHLEMVIS